MTTLPTRKKDKFANVEVRDFSTAHKMTRRQLNVMGAIAESRGDHAASGRWKELAMNNAMDESLKANIDEFNGTPLVEQAPAPAAPRLDPSTEFRRDSTHVAPGPETSPQGRRNQKLLDAQLKSMR